jgi:hypothetical protein
MANSEEAKLARLWLSNNGNDLEVVCTTATLGCDRETISLEATVVVRKTVAQGSSRHWCCAACGQAPPPFPLTDRRCIAEVLAYAEPGRLIFPMPENAEPGRDHYPVRGWRNTTFGVLCPACYATVEQTLAARRQPT